MTARVSKQYTFALDIAKFAKKTNMKYDRVVRLIAQQVWLALFRRSPVDTGRFRASWRIAFGAPDLSAEAFRPKTEESRARARAEEEPLRNAGLDKALIAKFGVDVWFTNSVEYALILEDGHSKRQAPLGVLSQSFEEVKAKVDTIIRAVGAA